MKKFIFYSSFAALGVFWAEVTSTNIALGLFHPFLYLIYGLLYVFFLDALIRWEGKDFWILYLFGMLIGLITETYVAKVTFFGLKPDAHRVCGVAPGAVLFVILFFHAYYSFLAPLYLAKKILAMPLALDDRKCWNIGCFLAPVFLAPIVTQQVVMRSKPLPVTVWEIILSAMVLTAWILMLRFCRTIDNVLLSKKQKLALFVFTLAVYSLFLIKATNQAHGHNPLDFPIGPMLVVTAIIAFALIIAYKALASRFPARSQVAYSAQNINWPLFAGWLFWHIAALGGFSLLQLANPFAKPAIVGIAIIGVTIAIVSIASVVVGIIKMFGTKPKSLNDRSIA